MRPEALAKRVATWARQTGRARPSTKDGWDVLVSEFLAHEVATFARATGRPRPKTARGIRDLVGEFVRSQAPVHTRPPLKLVGPAWQEIPESRTDLRLDDDGVSVQIEQERPKGTFKDDFDQMLEDRAQASIGPNGERLDDFDREWNLQQQTAQQLNREAPFTRDAPASLLSGSVGGNANFPLGKQVLGEQTYSSPIEVARWQGDDIDSRDVSCIFAPVIPPGPLNTGTSESSFGKPNTFRAVGTCQFGTRGFLSTVEMDIARGAQFTVCASTVILSVKASNTVYRAMSVSGMISMKACRGRPLYRTVYYNGLDASGSTGSLTVPPYAVNLYVAAIDSNAAAGNFSVFLQDAGTDQLAVIAVAAGANFPLPSVPLSGDIAFVSVNNNGNAIQNLALVFEIGV